MRKYWYWWMVVQKLCALSKYPKTHDNALQWHFNNLVNITNSHLTSTDCYFLLIIDSVLLFVNKKQCQYRNLFKASILGHLNTKFQENSKISACYQGRKFPIAQKQSFRYMGQLKSSVTWLPVAMVWYLPNTTKGEGT